MFLWQTSANNVETVMNPSENAIKTESLQNRKGIKNLTIFFYFPSYIFLVSYRDTSNSSQFVAPYYMVFTDNLKSSLPNK